MADEASSSVAPRKLKFAPKIPPRKPPKAAAPVSKIEAIEEAGHVLDYELLRRVKQAGIAPGRRAPTNERKVAPVVVASGHQNATTHARSYGVPRPQQEYDDGTIGVASKVDKEYVEPWNYYSYYPVTLPLRRPYSGNPEILDEEEFGESSVNLEAGTSRNHAEELGLMEYGVEPRMLFFQLPASLPLRKSSDDAEGKDVKGSTSEKHCGFQGLPSGLMGKMLVYKSGLIKMKLGDTVFDVTPGSKCIFAQDVMAINTQEKHCSLLGELNKRVVVTPDVESFLDSIDRSG